MTDRASKVPDTPEDLRPLLGATTKEATKAGEEAGYKVRLVREDGQPHVVTRDYRLDRINLYIESGKVVAAFLG